MRYAIFADVHSNLEALNAVLDAYKNEGVDKYVCAGDIVGYAADPGACLEKLKQLDMAAVAGNHDWASVNLMSLDYFNHAAREAILWTRHKISEEALSYLSSLRLVYKNDDLTLVHGTLNKPQDFAYMTDGYIAEESFLVLDSQVCFIGHSHVPGVFKKDKFDYIVYRRDADIELAEGSKYIVNVGSVGQPRDGIPQAAYCIYDTSKRLIQIKRVNYDIKACRDKIVNAGLPRSLGDRLMMGM